MNHLTNPNFDISETRVSLVDVEVTLETVHKARLAKDQINVDFALRDFLTTSWEYGLNYREHVLTSTSEKTHRRAYTVYGTIEVHHTFTGCREDDETERNEAADYQIKKLSKKLESVQQYNPITKWEFYEVSRI